LGDGLGDVIDEEMILFRKMRLENDAEIERSDNNCLQTQILDA
jgi:hypothetical protein